MPIPFGAVLIDTEGNRGPTNSYWKEKNNEQPGIH